MQYYSPLPPSFTWNKFLPLRKHFPVKNVTSKPTILNSQSGRFRIGFLRDKPCIQEVWPATIPGLSHYSLPPRYYSWALPGRGVCCLIKHSNHIITEQNHKISLVLIKCVYLLGKGFQIIKHFTDQICREQFPISPLFLQWHLKPDHRRQANVYWALPNGQARHQVRLRFLI